MSKTSNAKRGADSQQRIVRRCDNYRCKKEATWQDGWRGQAIHGKYWCTDHAIQFRNPNEIVPYYGDDIVENTRQETQPPNEKAEPRTRP